MTYFLHPHVIFFGNESNHSHQQEQFFPLVYFISIFGTPGKKRFFWGFRTQKFVVSTRLSQKNLKRRRTGLSSDVDLYAEAGAAVKLSGICELWEKGELTDLILCAECDGTSDGSPMKVHSVVMAVCSPILKAMLCNGMRESGQGTIILKDISPVALGQRVRFMYTDSLQIGPDSASALLVASDMLGMTSAKELCISWLEKHVNVESAVTVLDLADRHCCPRLQEVCELYICRHFTEFITVTRAGAAPVSGLSEVQLSRILTLFLFLFLIRIM